MYIRAFPGLDVFFNKFFCLREKLLPAVREIENSMRARDEQIEETKEQMNTVEDRVFKDFCKKIGVKNIRQYEERELGNYIIFDSFTY